MSKGKTIWGGRWKKINTLPGGGQSRTSLVTDLLNPSAKPAFLKEPIRVSKQSLGRLEEEANTLKILESSRFVPNLLDFSTKRSDAYLVMEHISGNSLSHLVEENLFTLEEACSFMLGLLHTIGECHDKGVVHRDLKPGNIMIRDGTRIPIVVDFGVGFRDDEDRNDLTRVDEDFGNRFAQGPETLSNSSNQRNPIQDLSNACSIFLYVLTGQKTGQYLNDEEQFPHQRPAAEKVLGTIEHSKRAQLLAIFDKAFQHSVKKRFQSVEELKSAIQRVQAPTSRFEQTVAEHHNMLRAAFSRTTVTTSDETDRILMTVVSLIKEAYESTRKELNSGFEFENFVEDSDDYGNKRVLVTRMYQPSNNQRDFPCTYTVTRIGSQIIVTTDLPDQPNLKRKDLEHVKLGLNEDICMSAKRFIAENLSRRLLLPNLLPVHRNIYEHIRQQRADLVHHEVLAIRNHRDETLVKGFEELSWLLKKYDIELTYSLGSTTVVTEAGPQTIDMPSVLLLSSIGSENKLRFWTGGKAEVMRIATHNFPGGHISQQMIFSPFTDRFLRELMKDKILPALQD